MNTVCFSVCSSVLTYWYQFFLEDYNSKLLLNSFPEIYIMFKMKTRTIADNYLVGRTKYD